MLVIEAIIEQTGRRHPDDDFDSVRQGMHRFFHDKCQRLAYTSVHEYLCWNVMMIGYYYLMIYVFEIVGSIKCASSYLD